MYEYLSLGAGVQSSTVLFMAEKGLIKPTPKMAIFADTQQEPEVVYRWIKFMREHVKRIEIRVATAGNLGEDALKIKTTKLGTTYLNLRIPMYVKSDSGGGILTRSCTRDYKISVVANTIKKDLNAGIRVSKLKGVLAKTWIGISFDESERKRPSQIRWLENRWPLLELGMTREDCLEWMKDNHYPVPPKSSCKQCPYHSDATWMNLKNNFPQDFNDAVEWERRVHEAIPQQENLRGLAYCHPSMVPLDQVVFNAEKKQDKFSRTCEGMCGV